MLSTQATDLIKEAQGRMVSPTYGKFIDEDVSRDARLADAALEFIKEYDGTFDFLVSLKDQWDRNNRLSLRQLASILNCMVAEIKRQERMELRAETERVRGEQGPTDVWSGEVKIPNGIYTVKFEDGSYKTLRLKESWREENDGEQVAHYLSGSDNDADYTAFAFVRHDKIALFKRFAGSVDLKYALTALLADKEQAKEMGVAYARESGNCFVCNRQLTTPESLESGIGPICAGKF